LLFAGTNKQKSSVVVFFVGNIASIYDNYLCM